MAQIQTAISPPILGLIQEKEMAIGNLASVGQMNEVREIPSVIARLTNSVQSLEAAMQNLEARLSPVTSPAAPAAVNTGKDGERASTDMAQMLSGLDHAVNSQTERLYSLVQRVQL